MYSVPLPVAPHLNQRQPRATRGQPARRSQQLLRSGRAYSGFRSRSRMDARLVSVAAVPANSKALRAEIEELQEERELALRTGGVHDWSAKEKKSLSSSSDHGNSLSMTAQLNSAKTKKLAKELQDLHNAAFQAVKESKETAARRLLEVGSEQNLPAAAYVSISARQP